jgi:pimeloyl-ACP methyl ester carboxylesterase
LAVAASAAVWLGLSTGCTTPVGADKAAPSAVYRQTHENAVSRSEPSSATLSVLHRFDQEARFAKVPQETLRLIHEKAVETGERGLLFALAELSYLAGEKAPQDARRSKPHGARDYYLASAVYAWFFLFGEGKDPTPDAFDQRFRTACDLYNYGLGCALTAPHSNDGVAHLAGGRRPLPVGELALDFTQPGFPWPLEQYDRFLIADQFLVRGLSVRNRTAGIGAPLIAVGTRVEGIGFSQSVPATVVLRIHGRLAELAPGGCRGALELYSPFLTNSVTIAERPVPLETDTTVDQAYALNQSSIWRLGKQQFFSSEQRVPTGLYTRQPYQPGRVPVVFVHGTFSSPVKWAEMVNTLSGDPELQRRYQAWLFIYNSGNPMAYSAAQLREALTAKIQELDPEGMDPALRQMVVIGHSQGGLLTKLTATDTGDQLLKALLRRRQVDETALSPEQRAALERYTCFARLPFVTRVVFISTPHRGSYLAGGLVRKLARKLVRLPSRVADVTKDLAGLSEKLDIPGELKGTPTSLDSMSPKNPFLLQLAEMPLAPGVTGHSIVAVKGDGDPSQGKDGLVRYTSAHVEYVESEVIVRGPHSCQHLPPAIEEVRRILREHLSELGASLRAER